MKRKARVEKGGKGQPNTPQEWNMHGTIGAPARWIPAQPSSSPSILGESGASGQSRTPLPASSPQNPVHRDPPPDLIRSTPDKPSSNLLSTERRAATTKETSTAEPIWKNGGEGRKERKRPRPIPSPTQPRETAASGSHHPVRRVLAPVLALLASSCHL